MVEQAARKLIGQPVRVLLVAVAAIVMLTPGFACAGEDHGHGGEKGDKQHKNAPTTPGAREIDVTGTSFEFTPAEISVEAGEDVIIALRATDIVHDFVVKGEGHIVSAKGKKTKRGGLHIDEPGTYKFWCSVPGHRKAGMKGTIVVQ